MSGPPPRPRDLTRQSAPVARLQRQSPGSGNVDLNRPSGGPPDMGRASLNAWMAKGQPNLERSSLYRASMEMAMRAEFPRSVLMTLQLVDVVSRSPVHYKLDGNRFAHSDATIKTVSNNLYLVNVITKPVVRLAEKTLFVTSVTPSGQIKRDAIELEEPKRGNGKEVTGTWRCDLPPCDKSGRVSVTLSGKFEDFGEFEAPILLKVYASGNKHNNQGFELKSVVFDLRRESEGNDSKVKVKSIRYM